MSQITLLDMYASPWCERVRWTFKFKGVPFGKQTYQPGPVDEEKVKKLTGQAQVPVLLVNGKAIPDSSDILAWLETYESEPSLVPKSEKDRAQVTMWEELMDGVLGPQARMLIIGHLLRATDPELQKAGQYFAQKCQYSTYAEEHAKVKVERVLNILKYALDGRQYLVGERFTLADVTAASMLLLVNPPPDELFLFPAAMRPMYTVPITQDVTYGPVFDWRDKVYRKHRGEAVRP
jgi:glutathione S-transferase